MNLETGFTALTTCPLSLPDAKKAIGWNFSSISLRTFFKLLSEQGVIVGYPDGTFKPDDNVTRAEFASMAIKALGQEHTKVIHPVNFKDITPDFWAYDVIQKALYFDLISWIWK